MPPNGTAGLARSRVRGSSRVPRPPASTMANTSRSTDHLRSWILGARVLHCARGVGPGQASRRAGREDCEGWMKDEGKMTNEDDECWKEEGRTASNRRGVFDFATGFARLRGPT